MRRRDLVFGGLAVAALAASEALRPRHRYKLVQNTTIEQIIPKAFSNWESQSVSELVGPQQAGRLARSLYSETVARAYFEKGGGPTVYVLAAYGDTQSDLLQLHRPESCYPAVGFTIRMARSVEVPLRRGVMLPARQVIAAIQDRSENILYWTRMGEALPRTGGEQRIARLENAMDGVVPDGILVRCSVVGDADEGFAILDRFVPAMLQATPSKGRPALVGTDISRRIA